MGAVRGQYTGGKVILSTPADWPEGTEVTVEQVDPVPGGFPAELPDDEDDSPAAIARRLALMDRVEPWMTPEEDEAWRKARAEQKALELANWDKWTRDIGKATE